MQSRSADQGRPTKPCVAVYAPQPSKISSTGTEIPSCSAIYRNSGAVPSFVDFRSNNVQVALDMSKEPRHDLSAVDSLYASFMHAVKNFGDAPFVGSRPSKTGEYVWSTYLEAEKDVAKMGTALMNLLGYTQLSDDHRQSLVDESDASYDYEKHASVFQRTTVGIMGANSPQYMCAIQALNRQNFVGVPLYDTLGDTAVEYILEHASVKVVFVADKKYKDLISSLKKKSLADQVQGIIVWKSGQMSDDDSMRAVPDLKAALMRDPQDQSKKFIMTYEDLIAFGAAAENHPVPPNPPKSYSISTLMYTSGTTGNPKGVILSHSNVIRMVAGNLESFSRSGFEFVPYQDSFLSFLPLAHIYDRVIEETIIFRGCKIGYWRGEVLTLTEDAKALKPTLFAAVPRVLERIYAKITGELQKASFIKRNLVNAAYAYKLKNLEAGHGHLTASPLLDKLVFSKAKEALGGNVRAMMSAGAPLPVHIEEFLKVFFCCSVIQGYGLTESTASAFMAHFDDWSMHGTVGVPTCAFEFKLESVPDMNYDAYQSYYCKTTGALLEDIVGGCTDIREGIASSYYIQQPPASLGADANTSVVQRGKVQGEVLLRGPVIFSRYYRNSQLTNEVIDEDGWFHTGDIAELTSFNGLKIIDRKKNIFKLSQGEYIAVEKLEMVYAKAPELEQLWVYGNSFESYLVCVGVLNMDYFWHAHVDPLLKKKVDSLSAHERDVFERLTFLLKEHTKTENTSQWTLATVRQLPIYPQIFEIVASSAWAKETLLANLAQLGKQNKLKGFEMLKGIHIETNSTRTFSIDNNLMTPTFKLKRPQLLMYYKPQIDALYQSFKAFA